MEITEQQLKKISEFVESKLDSLNWHHTLQVRKLALKIGSYEKADLNLIEASALLHDVGKNETDKDHAQLSAEMARKFLEHEKFNQNFIEETVYCILCHDYAWKGELEKLLTLESKVLADADILNWLSPMGIVKAIYHEEAFVKQDVNEAVKKILETVDKVSLYVQTKSAKKMIKERSIKVKEFYQGLLK